MLIRKESVKSGKYPDHWKESVLKFCSIFTRCSTGFPHSTSTVNEVAIDDDLTTNQNGIETTDDMVTAQKGHREDIDNEKDDVPVDDIDDRIADEHGEESEDETVGNTADREPSGLLASNAQDTTASIGGKLFSMISTADL